jgi:hypothetical protein
MTAKGRQKIKQHRVGVAFGVVGIVLVVVIALIIVGYRFDWTGFNGNHKSGKTLWDWMQLLVIPIALAIAGLSYNLVRDRTDRRIAHDELQADVLQEYINKLSELLLDKDLDSNPNAQYAAWMRTLAVLNRLDTVHRQSLVQFWYGSGFNNINIGQSLLELSYANLSQIDLSGADLNRIVLIGANLSGSDLGRANLSEADLSDTDLTGANLQGAKLFKANLQGSDLSEADLRKADLSEAKVTEEQLKKAKSLKGATLPSTYELPIRGALPSTHELPIRGALPSTHELPIRGALPSTHELPIRGALPSSSEPPSTTMPDGSKHS